jgi:glycosyltransferase involved in cell wall biosynthesis
LKTNGSINRLAFIGSYSPRQCGIATFTTDLCESVSRISPETACVVIPVSDGDASYDYPSRVCAEIREHDLDTYKRVAESLNASAVDLVCLQHEYGIFGGAAGSHILALLQRLRLPVVTTFHTVLQNPSPAQYRVLVAVADYSQRVVVMSTLAVQRLIEVYGIPPWKIDFIPHGIPDVPFEDPDDHKVALDFGGKTVLLSFGLLSPDKGIENVIAALPSILSVYPETVYVILGATHPHVKRGQGEAYRTSLQSLARSLDVEDRVVFHNRFVGIDELMKFIGATDIYITPYLKSEQITSGTLAYTLGAGKAVISTPYDYARDLLADGRGRLVPIGNPAAIAASVREIMADVPARIAMRRKAYDHGREMIWPVVSGRYLNTFSLAKNGFDPLSKPVETTPSPEDRRIQPPADFPPLCLDHLKRMTDDTGMFQHALFSIPNLLEGYTTDDNARALIVTVLLEEVGDVTARGLLTRYLAFLAHALDPSTGQFRNFMDYQRNWLEAKGSDDSHGRTLWALATMLRGPGSPSLHGAALHIFRSGLASISDMTSPRAWAFTLLGLDTYLKRHPDDAGSTSIRNELAERLLALHDRNRTEDWPWCEDHVTYCNAVLPHALIVSGVAMEQPDMIHTGLESLEWLSRLHGAGDVPDHFVPVGSNGFYSRGGERALFDQQPVEIQAMVSACLEAYRVTGDTYWRIESRRAFEWFLGRNDLHRPVYDPTTGGCRDGLHEDRLNENQGAESTLAFLQAMLELQLAQHDVPSGVPHGIKENTHT